MIVLMRWCGCFPLPLTVRSSIPPALPRAGLPVPVTVMGMAHPDALGDLPYLRLDYDAPIQSKSNFRRHAKSRDWGRFRDFETGLGLQLRAGRPPEWQIADPSLPLARRPVVVAAIWARTTLDAGNLSKSVLDAAQGVLYVTDASVRAVAEMTERAGKDQRAVIAFAQLPPQAEAHEIARVTSVLLSAVCPLDDLR